VKAVSIREESMTLVTLMVLMLLAQAGVSPPSTSQSQSVVVVLETEAGQIELEIDTARAPITSANFLKYVDAGIYDGSQFFRTVRPDTETRQDVPIDVIVADLDPSQKGKRFPPIPLERTNVTGLKHVDGTVSMGRTRGPDTAMTEFFICIGDQPLLDFGGQRNQDGQGFAVFGRVSSGMDVVKKIHLMPTEGQRLTPPVRIIRAYRR
jgi:peptidyl-prolyl cis-trans isomerase A (cyclophilin A)